jgi:putative hydrolase of the HAD superfamily
MIRAFITDFGGVLMRTMSDKSRRGLEAELGLPPNSIEMRIFNSDLSTRSQLGEMHVDAFWEDAVRELGAAISPVEFRRRMFADDVLDQELMSLIRSLRPAYKTGLISNTWDDARHLFTDVLSVADAFDTMVISAEERVMKPDPRIYHIALERLDVSAEEAIFLDDVRENVQGAVALGMQGIHFQTAQQAMHDIRQLLRIA